VSSAGSYRVSTVQYTTLGKQAIIPKPANVSIDENLTLYESYIKQAAGNASQIVIFPEGTTGYSLAWDSWWNPRDAMKNYIETVPAVINGVPRVIPCNDPAFQNSPQLRRLSCAALQNNIIVVANMGDLQPCSSSNDPNCPKDGRYQYNTEVVFGENGQILSRYHKIHLFDESDAFNEVIQNEPAYFDSRFGVRFGLMVCFDLQFAHPLQDYIDMGIKDILHSSDWVNILPVQTAIQVHQGKSYVLGINFINANTGTTGLTSGGGIYSQGIPIAYHYDPLASDVFFMSTADLPILTTTQDILSRNHHANYHTNHTNIKKSHLFHDHSESTSMKISESNPTPTHLSKRDLQMPQSSLPQESPQFIGSSESNSQQIQYGAEVDCYLTPFWLPIQILPSGKCVFFNVVLGGEFSANAQHNGLNCTVTATVSPSVTFDVDNIHIDEKSAVYALAAANTSISFQNTPHPLPLVMCAWIPCANPPYCGVWDVTKYPPMAEFDTVVLSSSFDEGTNIVPAVLTANEKLLIPGQDWQYEQQQDDSATQTQSAANAYMFNAKLSLLKPNTTLSSFVLYGSNL
jgi:predicted amidohydrolase